MKRVLVTGAALAIGIAGMGVSQAAKPADSGFKVTGGGQIIADGVQGAGDTVGFNAHELNGDDTASDAPDDAARGQFQYVPRGQSTNDSAPDEKFHGIVTCLISGSEAQANEENEEDGEENEALQPGSARFGGYVRGTEGDSLQYFTVDVTDNGQGSSAQDDLILVRFTSEPCGDNPEDEENDAEQMLRLGRGNVKIHNNPDGEASSADNARTKAALMRLAL